MITALNLLVIAASVAGIVTCGIFVFCEWMDRRYHDRKMDDIKRTLP